MEEKKRCGAVVLAAGAGKRMQSKIKKQFLEIDHKPLIAFSLEVFQQSFIDEIVLVVSKEDLEYCRREIVEKYRFTKVTRIVTGGRERYHSVAAGLYALENCDYVFIHDGARPFITGEILERAYREVISCEACVVGMPVKDTIKIADTEGYVQATPDRELLWTIQTPQVFGYKLIRDAYTLLLEKEEELSGRGIHITDDAMVVETLTQHRVKLVEGSYDNIKVTTPEDLVLLQKLKRETGSEAACKEG